MEPLPLVVACIGFTVAGGLLVAVVVQMLTGVIPLRDLLATKGGSPAVSNGRVQLFVFTVAAAVYELRAIVTAHGGLPDLPTPWVVALGGSHAFYLLGKHRERPYRPLPSEKEPGS